MPPFCPGKRHRINTQVPQVMMMAYWVGDEFRAVLVRQRFNCSALLATIVMYQGPHIGIQPAPCFQLQVNVRQGRK